MQTGECRADGGSDRSAVPLSPPPPSGGRRSIRPNDGRNPRGLSSMPEPTSATRSRPSFLAAEQTLKALPRAHAACSGEGGALGWQWTFEAPDDKIAKWFTVSARLLARSSVLLPTEGDRRSRFQGDSGDRASAARLLAVPAGLFSGVAAKHNCRAVSGVPLRSVLASMRTLRTKEEPGDSKRLASVSATETTILGKHRRWYSGVFTLLAVADPGVAYPPGVSSMTSASASCVAEVSTCICGIPFALPLGVRKRLLATAASHWPSADAACVPIDPNCARSVASKERRPTML
mmetsp:Transcript_72900/g.202271  ORF Transcript_72900/g.202271 Transcript_72900/m.202271 type:complete len:291 (-) Transcript_72900:398-1270(-)